MMMRLHKYSKGSVCLFFSISLLTSPFSVQFSALKTINWKVSLMPRFNTGALSCWGCVGGEIPVSVLLFQYTSVFCLLSSMSTCGYHLQRNILGGVIIYNYLVFQNTALNLDPQQKFVCGIARLCFRTQVLTEQWQFSFLLLLFLFQVENRQVFSSSTDCVLL